MTFEMNRVNGNLRYSIFTGNGQAKTDSTEYDIPNGGKFTAVVALQIKNTLLKDLSIPKEKIKVTVEWE
ncbi:MAG: hypothetical protein ACYDAO_05165 [Thermoplasmataceae archaeon]